MSMWEGRFWITVFALPFLYKVWTFEIKDPYAGVQNLGESGHFQTLFGTSEKPNTNQDEHPTD